MGRPRMDRCYALLRTGVEGDPFERLAAQVKRMQLDLEVSKTTENLARQERDCLKDAHGQHNDTFSDELTSRRKYMFSH
jgi:hypothetical protein